MNRLLVVATFVLLGFLVGAAVISMNVFPTAIIKRAFVSVGIPVAPTGPPLDRRFAWNDIEVAGSVDDTSQQGTIKGAAVTYQSPHLQAGITVLDGVFNPYEAEWTMLPIMQNNADRFLGKTVMEIGTGSGIISLYAAKLGAAKVVATDISPAAIKTITMNADALDYASVIQPRLVPLDDISAYSVIAPDEKFDVIISNPPFALDLDAGANDAVTDTGELGFSIVRGLEDHLNSNGVVILLYDSLFYHQVMAACSPTAGRCVTESWVRRCPMRGRSMSISGRRTGACSDS